MARAGAQPVWAPFGPGVETHRICEHMVCVELEIGDDEVFFFKIKKVLCPNQSAESQFMLRREVECCCTVGQDP